MRDEHTEYSCAAALAIEVLQGKWRIQILCVMREGPVRLGQLRRLIPSASKKVLTENLRKLESVGLVTRTDLSDQIRRVEYDLTESARLGTYQLLDQLAEWREVYEKSKLIHKRDSFEVSRPGERS
jgi:DNA-binding HxlR family transcriptional regulator